MTSTDKTALRISGPADLISAVPYLLGFHPQDSLVLVGLTDRRLVVAARLDLDTTDHETLTHTIGAITRGGTTEIIIAIYTGHTAADTELPHTRTVDLVAAAAKRAGVRLVECLLVTDERWWSYSCQSPACCPPEGRALTDTTAVQTQAVVAGLTVAPTRDALADRFTPSADRTDLVELIARHQDLDVSPTLDGTTDARARMVTSALFTAHRAAQAGRMPSDDDVARFGVSLRSYAIRDTLWMAMDDRRLDGIELWVNLARRLPGPYAAAPLFFAAWSAYRDGKGALASIAAERALQSDPGYSAADLLLAALAQGVDPRRLPRLRLPRGGDAPATT